MTDSHYVEDTLRFIESLFVRYGAVATELDAANWDKDDQRVIYALNGSYYRTGIAEFDGELFFLLSSIDSKKFADLGILEDIDALAVDTSREQIEKAVRYALGVEPYPEQYPAR